MKNFKKILCMFLAVALMVTSFAAVSVMAEETETTQTAETIKFPDVLKSAKYATAVEVLNKLSIINGYEDGTFKPENNVSRAEFAALLLRMLGLDQNLAPMEAPFPDVAADFWAAGTIGTAKRLGIITGYEDGTFGPLNNVAYEEALTMIIRAINYSNYSAPGELWYSSYLESARRLDIVKNAIGNVGSPASRACIAQFIYNTLEVYVRENDVITNQLIMEKHLGISKNEGIIASNSYTSLEAPDVNLKENEVMIMDAETGNVATYSVENLADYDDEIGAKITYYSRQSKTSAYREIVMFSVNRTVKKETIDASLIEKYDANYISYYKSLKSSSLSNLKLNEDNVVIYNGKLYGNNASASKFAYVISDGKVPEVGQISALDRDNDGDYDVIFVDAYKHYAVSSVVSSTYTVTDKITSTQGESVVLDYTDDNQVVSFVSASGNKLSFSSIRKNTAIAVKESNDNSGTKLITVVIMDKNVSGQVNAISADSLKVGSTEYEYSSIAAWRNGGILETPEKGGKYTFFLDVNGKIFAYVKNESAEDGAKYGYIIDFRQDSGSSMDDAPVYLQILTQTGSKQWIPMAKNTKINGTSIDGQYKDAVNNTLVQSAKEQNLAGLANQGARQVIKYTLKTSGGTTVFDEIVTVIDDTNDDTAGGEPEDDELRMYGGFKSDETAKYSTSGKQFAVGKNKVYLGSATVFVVPEDMSQTDDYKKGGTSDFKDGKSYYIEAFDISSSKTAKVVVLYGGDSTTPVSSTTAIFRVEDMEEEENSSKGEIMLKITGYEGTSEKSYWVSPKSAGSVEDLEKGDLVRFGFDADGFATLESDDILYTADTDPYYFAWDEDYTAVRGDRPTKSEIEKAKAYESAEFKVILGTLASIDDDYVMITTNASGDTSDDMETLRIELSKLSGVKVLRYDTTQDPVEITDITGSDTLETLNSYPTYEENRSSAAKVFVHMAFSSVKSIIIVE